MMSESASTSSHYDELDIVMRSPASAMKPDSDPHNSYRSNDTAPTICEEDDDSCCSCEADAAAGPHIRHPPEVVPMKKLVRFSFLEVREYPIIMGDNPASFMGLPLTIDWDYDRDTVVRCDLDAYEGAKSRQGHAMTKIYKASERKDLLIRVGYSRQELQEGERVVNLARGQRQRTKETIHLANVEECVQRAKKKLLNFTTRRGTKKKERTFLQRYAS